MMNLFLLITIQQYNDFFSKPENPIEIFNNIVEAFRSSWNQFSSEESNGHRVKANILTEVLLNANIDFLNKYNHSRDRINKYILDLNVLK